MTCKHTLRICHTSVVNFQEMFGEIMFIIYLGNCVMIALVPPT